MFVGNHALFRPGHFNPKQVKSWRSDKIFTYNRLLRGEGERASRDDDIVVGEDEGILKLTHDLAENFRFRKGVRVEDDVDIAIKAAFANKVMIGLVIELDTVETENVAKVLEKIDSFLVFCINIGITTYKYQCSGILLSKLIKADS